MIAEIKALDTLFFRDGKPFSRGEETWADGVFPPYPSVLYGALRTWFISNHPEPYSKTAVETSERIEIRSSGYRLSYEVYLPMPLDLAEPKDKKAEEKRRESFNRKYEVIRLQPQPMEDLISNYPCPILLVPPAGTIVETVEYGLLQQADLISYLNAPTSHYSIRKISDFVVSEPKTGIGRNDFTHTAADSLLYRVGMRRAKDFEILLDFDLPDSEKMPQPTSFFVKLGAENKVAEVRRSRRSIRIKPEEIPLEGSRFKLYLSTPAIFDEGWRPNLLKYGINAELAAAAVGKPIHIGGFDMEKGKPKPMYRAVPAGSVYFYETPEDLLTVKEKLFGKAISDKMPEQGYGIAYLGNWQIENS